MAKPRQVQSCAYVGTLLSPQRLQTRLKQRFFQIPLKRTFFQCDLQGSPEFPVSLPLLPLQSANAEYRPHAGDPRPGRYCPSFTGGSGGGGGPVFHCRCGFSGPHTLGGPTEGSCSTKQVKMGMGGRGSHMQTRARGMPPPPPPDIVASPTFSSPSSPSKGQNCVSSKGAGPPRARVKGGRNYSSQF